MTGRLMHYDAEPFHLDRTRRYPQREVFSSHNKPHGLWVSVEGEDDWPSWCREEHFGVDKLAAAHEVTLTDDARILWLETEDHVRALPDTFGRPTKYGDVGIDWQAVAERYQGIIITPYQWSCRMSLGTEFYYGWDCASGCIWDLDAIATFEHVGREVEACTTS